MIQTTQARFAQQFEEDTCVPQVVVVNELEDLEMTLEMVGGDPTCRSTVIYSSASDLPDEVARWHACGHRGRFLGFAIRPISTPFLNCPLQPVICDQSPSVC